MSMKEKRNNSLYNHGFIFHGNGKLLDYTDENGHAFRYAQFNTRPVVDCPFATDGCKAVCYATKGNHMFPSVKSSRERSYIESKRADFAESVVYTLRTEKETARYKNATMIVRIHESGDFYSVQYLRKWVKVWAELMNDSGIVFVMYTKSFRFFLMLTEEEKATVNRALESGRISINLSMDDTVSNEQKTAYLAMLATFPKCNTYYCTEHTETVEHDTECDCADCAKCGKCNKAEGRHTVVKIHSASNADMDTYRKNIK